MNKHESQKSSKDTVAHKVKRLSDKIGARASRTVVKLKDFDERHGISATADYNKQIRKAAENIGGPGTFTAARERARILRIREINAQTTHDVEGYLADRRTAEPWTTVEIGPRSRPVGLNRSFAGDSAYVGVERHIGKDAELNRQYSTRVFEKLNAERPGENIRLLSGDTAEIPDGSANEVFAAYVYDDPRTDTKLVTSEAFRMLKPGGFFVVNDVEDHMYGWLGKQLTDQGFELAYMEQNFSKRFPKDQYPMDGFNLSELYHAISPVAGEQGLGLDQMTLAVLIAAKPLQTTEV